MCLCEYIILVEIIRREHCCVAMGPWLATHSERDISDSMVKYTTKFEVVNMLNGLWKISNSVMIKLTFWFVFEIK